MVSPVAERGIPAISPYCATGSSTVSCSSTCWVADQAPTSELFTSARISPGAFWAHRGELLLLPFGTAVWGTTV